MGKLLLTTLVLFVVLLFPCSQAEQSARGDAALPVISITEPKTDKVIRLGDTLRVAWDVSSLSGQRDDWDVSIYLQDCGVARIRIYEDPFVKAPKYINWVLTASKITPQIKRGDTTSFNVWVCLHNRREGNEELLAMAKSCKAVEMDQFLMCKWGDSTIALKP